MKLLQIKFSHKNYRKFYLKDAKIENNDMVNLVGVSVCNIDDLPEDFKYFDANYGTEDEPEYYPLPKGKVIVLFFWYDDLFPTIRRWTPKKEEYYKESIGKEFLINIKEGGLK